MFSDEQIEAFKRFKVFPSTKKGIELRIQDELTHKFNKCQEPDEHKWALIGVGSSSGKRYFRDVCWNCFRTNLRNRAIDGKHIIPCNTKPNSWWMKIIRGEDTYPNGQASAIGKYWADLMFTSLTKDELKSISSKFDTASLDSFKRRYGDEIGQKKYEEYVKFHSDKNKFEYKHEHLGWNREQFDEFNKNRSVTLELCTKKHGTELGNKIFNEYCDKQAYAGCKLEYFIEKYGDEEGKRIYDELSVKKSITKQTFIDKYGYEDGIMRWKHKIEKLMKSSLSKSWSSISQELFNKIMEHIPSNEWNKVRYATMGGEDCIEGNLGFMFPDFIYDNKKIIEFNGDYWHKNPKLYLESDEGVNEKWKYDKLRLNELKRLGYDVMVVWEMDYKEDKLKTIDACLEFLELKRI